MKLSEAIRLGSMLKPQGHGMLSTGRATCALGAAHEACPSPQKVWLVTSPLNLSVNTTPYRGEPAYVEPGTVERSDVPGPEWSVIYWNAACPACALEPPATASAPAMAVFRLIPHLNDDHRWTREQIADWVETIEQQQSAPTPQPEQVRA